ncbi:hypothetical protein Pdw03_7315 [Penicillium digitatum]|uniref:HNH nuclease domain-containing protein n=1 Tax=Penicillium digitatum TaxID=36651 RepID=A0A7T7BKS3_PENDI|nr:hypothetical protein Pdw03_7315 [Penicillium digitatum]
MSNASAGTLPPGSSSELGRSSTVVRVNDENFNIPSTHRKIIIRQLKKALLEQEVPSPLWAVFQVCDMEKLECILQLAHFSLKIMDAICDLICTLPFKWTVTPSPSQQLEPGCRPSSFSPRPRAPPIAIYAARERDGYKCVITGTRKIYQTAPIFPASAVSSGLRDDPLSPNIWRFADVFWGKDRAERWKKAVFNKPTQPGSLVNDCSNLICLRRDLRSAWSSAEARPQALRQRKRGDPTYRAIESGYRFKMTTDDPVKRPLPSFDLLDMQWHFTRLIGLCAAGTFFDKNSEDDDDAKSDITTHPDQPSTPPNNDLLAWIESSSHDFDAPPDPEYVEDTSASMMGPLPGSNPNRSRSVSQASKSSEKSADPADSAASGSLESSASEMINVISGTGHLSLDFKSDS